MIPTKTKHAYFFPFLVYGLVHGEKNSLNQLVNGDARVLDKALCLMFDLSFSLLPYFGCTNSDDYDKTTLLRNSRRIYMFAICISNVFQNIKMIYTMINNDYII